MTTKVVVIKTRPLRVKVKKKAIVLARGSVKITVWSREKRRHRRLLIAEVAKSSRSKCKYCRKFIPKGDLRVGLITFIPHRNVKWYHLQNSCLQLMPRHKQINNAFGWGQLSPGHQTELTVSWQNMQPRIPKPLTAGGALNMTQLAAALNGRYQRFRSFRFGLPDHQMYGENWNWRCFLATMLVCNTRESAMLRVTDRLFTAFATPTDLLQLYEQPGERRRWRMFMESEDLRHPKRKLRHILYATKLLGDKYKGRIPTSRKALREIPGVGPHVSSVTLAWVHQAPEFGVDVHVRRIMERWKLVKAKVPEIQIEKLVKEHVPAEQLGHFSRSFVDHGQSVCGYVPDCHNCYLRNSCPSAAKYLEW